MTASRAPEPADTRPPGRREPSADGSRGGPPGVGAVVAGAVSTFVALTVGVGLVWLRQERIVWQPPRVGAGERLTPPGAERIDYEAEDGQPLFGYVVRAPGGGARRGVLLAFHGNADLATWTVPWAREVARRTGYDVLVPEYRGYAGLPGAPNYPCSKLDAHAAHAAAVARLGALPAEVALFGHSLGTALAAELADALARSGGAPRALVLQAPFTSAKAMARVVLSEGIERWWRRISRVHFDTEALVTTMDVPVWVAHGTLDLIIPARMGRRVFARARRPGELLVVPRAGHNDVADAGGERYWAWLERALAADAADAPDAVAAAAAG
jgi:hypothetical protein